MDVNAHVRSFKATAVTNVNYDDISCNMNETAKGSSLLPRHPASRSAGRRHEYDKSTRSSSLPRPTKARSMSPAPHHVERPGKPTRNKSLDELELEGSTLSNGNARRNRKEQLLNQPSSNVTFPNRSTSSSSSSSSLKQQQQHQQQFMEHDPYLDHGEGDVEPLTMKVVRGRNGRFLFVEAKSDFVNLLDKLQRVPIGILAQSTRGGSAIQRLQRSLQKLPDASFVLPKQHALAIEEMDTISLLHPNATYLVTNDLDVIESNIDSHLKLLHKYGVDDMAHVQASTVEFGASQVRRLVGALFQGDKILERVFRLPNPEEEQSLKMFHRS